jgi:hypothetical protein
LLSRFERITEGARMDTWRTWQHGLLRLWIVISLIWIIGVAWLSWPTSIAPFFELRETLANCATPGGDGPWCDEVEAGISAAQHRLLLAAYVLISFPVGSFLLGAVVAWIVRGFGAPN